MWCHFFPLHFIPSLSSYSQKNFFESTSLSNFNMACQTTSSIIRTVCIFLLDWCLSERRKHGPFILKNGIKRNLHLQWFCYRWWGLIDCVRTLTSRFNTGTWFWPAPILQFLLLGCLEPLTYFLTVSHLNPLTLIRHEQKMNHCSVCEIQRGWQ